MNQAIRAADAAPENPSTEADAPHVKVLHLITYFPVFHGAQENTCLTVNYHDKQRYEVWLGTQPGGSLLPSVQSDVQVALLPHLQRAVHPLKDLLAFWEIYRLCRRERFTIVHTHISRQGYWDGWLRAWQVCRLSCIRCIRSRFRRRKAAG